MLQNLQQFCGCQVPIETCYPYLDLALLLVKMIVV